MTDKSREEFEGWYCGGTGERVDWDETLDMPASPIATSAWNAWQHQQRKIDILREAHIKMNMRYVNRESAEKLVDELLRGAE